MNLERIGEGITPFTESRVSRHTASRCVYSVQACVTGLHPFPHMILFTFLLVRISSEPHPAGLALPEILSPEIASLPPNHLLRKVRFPVRLLQQHWELVKNSLRIHPRSKASQSRFNETPA